jgi:4-carboxymuconolactone decarboxylase
MSKYEVGLKRIQEILGTKAIDLVENFKKISPDFANYIVEFAYGDLYDRKGITDKSRELAAVANLVGQGNTGLPLKAHISGMLNVGWTKEEIIELIIFLIGYSGFPTAVEAIKIAQEVFESYEASKT